MRRASKNPAISPQQLKHFAIAAVVLTLLLALFATDEDWGAQAQIEANNTKNQLAAAEAEKLGTAKLATKLKVRADTTGGGFGGDEGGGPAATGGWGGSMARAPSENVGPRQRLNGVPQLEQRAGASVTVHGTDIDDVRQPDPAKRSKKRSGKAFMPDAQQIEKIKEASRQRTGGRSGGDE